MQEHNYTYQSDFAKKYVAEGVEQGYRAVLRKHLERRFGALPAEAVDKLDAADTLDTWIDRAFTAATLVEVFAPSPR